ncbi:MAG: chromosome condensation regulator [Hyperionvirus sp.]|uniref:Chromosome condensation regulator n=1 Tax=Hyperionvirus sp. TaxID=2487770 RepID=A0A3G5ACR1_9VIRU|nr:MAG: chromosome condensation regulator [Hyperionvirus sp.]
MDSLFINLPVDLQYIIVGYNPRVIFNLSRSELEKYDWFKLIKIIFSLGHEKSSCTNEEIMRAYLHNCKHKSKIICSFTSTIVRLIDGRLMVSGYNVRENIFKEVNLPSQSVEIIVGGSYTIIKLRDGTLMRGLHDNGLWDIGLGGDGKIFIGIDKIPGDIAELVSGQYHSIIRLKDGTLMSWGYNTCGELGLGDNNNRNMFEKIINTPKNIVEVICGSYFTFIKLADGTLMSCGNNDQGQLGLGDNNGRNIFCEIKGIPKNIAKVICGMHHCIIQLTDGTLMCCGKNDTGELGLGD